jgi:N-acyl-D-amino-acid deacylase
MKLSNGSPRRRSRHGWIALALTGVATLFAGACIAIRFVHHPEHDLLIRDVLIHDGTGGEPFVGSVAVDGDTITAIYPAATMDLLTRPIGRTTIVAKGLAVAPGFIDTHTHADLSIVGSSGPIRANNFVGQGVTTIITGNCGRSPVDIGGFSQSILTRGTNVNIATLIGLGSIRADVMRSSTAPAKNNEIARMCKLVDAGMRAGAVGVSTGAAYVPGRFASDEETIAQLSVAGRQGGVYATHLRDEGTSIVNSVTEALRFSERARIPLLISHFKIVGVANCNKYRVVEHLIDTARRQGHTVLTDQYPYAASSSSLDLYLPDWFIGTRGAARRAFLDTVQGQARLSSWFRERLSGEGFHDLGFAYVASYEKEPGLAGLSLAQITTKNGEPDTMDGQIRTMFDLLRHGGAQMVYHNICTEPIAQIAAQPTSMFGSDSAIRYSGGDYLPHPRGWGTFPRVLAHLVRRQNALPLEEAIRKMTSLPAAVFGLERRGIIRPGYYADLVIFDPAMVADRATYRKPLLPPRGIIHVVVNGKLVVAESQSAAKRIRGVPDVLPVFAGRFLKRHTEHSQWSLGERFSAAYVPHKSAIAR